MSGKDSKVLDPIRQWCLVARGQASFDSTNPELHLLVRYAALPTGVLSYVTHASTVDDVLQYTTFMWYTGSLLYTTAGVTFSRAISCVVDLSPGVRSPSGSCKHYQNQVITIG